MLRNLVIILGLAALAVSATISFSDYGKNAEAKLPDLAREQAQPAAGQNPNPNLKPANPLPISKVVLFNSGVGYFHRSGMVEGDARVDLQFQATDINDLIKSMVLDDPKGIVLPLRYDSQEPIEKTLRSFAINLSTNPTFGQILNQARGEKIELTLLSNNSGLPGTISGTIIGMESAHRLPSPSATSVTEMEFLNLMCAEGMRSVPVTQIQRLRFLNSTLETELKRALDVVASGHDSQKKSVRLGFRGEGKREVHVGYVTENPIWKTSYRIVIDKNNKARLLGWANVENTSDEDWNDVNLSLVSSRPISFQMDLYQPLFLPRPIVEPELFASLRPPTYSGPLSNLPNFAQFGFQGGMGNLGGNTFNQFGQGLQNPSLPQLSMNNMGNRSGVLGFGGGVMGGGVMGFEGGGMGNGTNFQQMNPGFGFNRYQNNDVNNFINNAKLTYKDLKERKNNADQKSPSQSSDNASKLGTIMTGVDPDLIESALQAENLGNPARFTIAERVTLPRQQSTMLPILDQQIDATLVSVYSQNVQSKHPLFGMRIKNTSKQSLMQGPITVYRDQQYAGDARILDLQPGEERYISYGIDSGIEVLPFDRIVPSPELTARMENGKLQVQYRMRNTRSYVMKNRSPEARRVIIEQPVRAGWEFTESRKMTMGDPKAGVAKQENKWIVGDKEKPIERTRDVYRFQVEVPSGETVKYVVSEELPRIDPFQSSKQTDWTGFATTLGLDVWTDSHRQPEDQFGIELTNSNSLKVTHKDRRSTTYFLRNREGIERTVWLEHFVPEGRHLLGSIKPEANEIRRYRFKMVLPPGGTLSQNVIEEFIDVHSETIVLKSGDRYNKNQMLNDLSNLPSDRFITELGFEIWRTTESNPEELTSAEFNKGHLVTTAKVVENFTYTIHDLSNQDRSFTIDHHVRPDWNYRGVLKPVAGTRNCIRTSVQVPKGKSMKQQIAEEKSISRVESLESLTEERTALLTTSKVTNKNVKDNILKGTSMIKELHNLKASIAELQVEMKSILEEQSRIKGNLDKLPATTDLYKRLITKFDVQESALEKVQKALADLTIKQKQQAKDFTDFLVQIHGK